MQRTKAQGTKKEQARSRALADALGSLGYPGFVNVLADEEEDGPKHDPAVVLLAALTCDHLEERVVEALPWVAVTFQDLDWDWIIREARSRKAQNRLGFVVCLALRVAASNGAPLVQLTQLASIEERLFEVRLEQEDTFCRKLPEAERRWLRESRPAEARQWNLLTDLRPQDLSY